MNLAILIVRILVGLIFVVFGLNGFLHLIPLPPKEGRAAQFMGAINGSGYMAVVYLLQIAGGALLLGNFHVPLGLLLLGPVVVNIVLFHVFLDPKAMAMAAPIGILAAFLLWAYWPSFAPIFY